MTTYSSCRLINLFLPFRMILRHHCVLLIFASFAITVHSDVLGKQFFFFGDGGIGKIPMAINFMLHDVAIADMYNLSDFFSALKFRLKNV